MSAFFEEIEEKSPVAGQSVHLVSYASFVEEMVLASCNREQEEHPNGKCSFLTASFCAQGRARTAAASKLNLKAQVGM
jgi:hypothetical protein